MSDQILEKIKNNWKLVILAGLVVAAVFFSVSAFIPPKYKAETSLSISHEDQASLDAYRDAKSSEFSARIIHEVILSNYFISLVFDGREDLKNNFFDSEKYQSEQLKIWKKRIKVSQVPNTGLLSISVYSESKSQSHEIATIISNLLKAQSGNLIGKKGVTVKQINSPYVINDPAFPNVWLNAFLGFIFGVFVFVAFAYVTKGDFIEWLNSIFARKRKSVDYNDYGEEKDYSIEKIKDSAKKELDYASTYFNDYVFDSKKNNLNESEKKTEKEEIEFFKNEKNKSKKKIIEIEEPNSFGGELSFEDVLVDKNEKNAPDFVDFDQQGSKKTPNNLPTLEGGMESLLGKQDDFNENKEVSSVQQKEPTEDEVKEKLNKLLRGEME